MEWICVSVCTTSFGIDAVCSALEDIGISGFEIEDESEFTEFLENNKKYWDYVDDELIESKKGETKVKFYIENNADAPGILSLAERTLAGIKKSDSQNELGSLSVDTLGLNEEDWANNWKEYFKPLPVGDKILIQPEWSPLEGETDRVVFTVNPGMTFGTGTHASTKMCICQMEKYVDSDTVMLDAGCGSGILSVIALMLGAKHASAVDIDENCIHVAYENADRNGVDRKLYEVYAGDVTNDKALFSKLAQRKYNVIVANIVADVIIALLPTVKELIEEDGVFICSGIIAERLPDVKTAMEKENVPVSSVVTEDGWCCITSLFSK